MFEPTGAGDRSGATPVPPPYASDHVLVSNVSISVSVSESLYRCQMSISMYRCQMSSSVSDIRVPVSVSDISVLYRCLMPDSLYQCLMPESLYRCQRSASLYQCQTPACPRIDVSNINILPLLASHISEQTVFRKMSQQTELCDSDNLCLVTRAGGSASLDVSG